MSGSECWVHPNRFLGFLGAVCACVCVLDVHACFLVVFLCVDIKPLYDLQSTKPHEGIKQDEWFLETAIQTEDVG